MCRGLTQCRIYAMQMIHQATLKNPNHEPCPSKCFFGEKRLKYKIFLLRIKRGARLLFSWVRQVSREGLAHEFILLQGAVDIPSLDTREKCKWWIKPCKCLTPWQIRETQYLCNSSAVYRFLSLSPGIRIISSSQRDTYISCWHGGDSYSSKILYAANLFCISLSASKPLASLLSSVIISPVWWMSWKYSFKYYLLRHFYGGAFKTVLLQFVCNANIKPPTA